MKIIFQREGFANNSSSSHSIIFLEDKTYKNLIKRSLIGTDEYKEFGWDQFSISNTRGKLNYFLLCIVPFNYHHSYPRDGENQREFTRRINKEFNTFFNLIVNNGIYTLYDSKDKPTKSELKKDLLFGYVDHQSTILFPYYRNKKEINFQFFKDFLKEILKPNYIILGGNDNSDNDHWLLKKKVKKEKDIIKLLTKLSNAYEITYCEYDKVSNQYVLSFSDGSLYIIEF